MSPSWASPSCSPCARIGDVCGSSALRWPACVSWGRRGRILGVWPPRRPPCRVCHTPWWSWHARVAPVGHRWWLVRGVRRPRCLPVRSVSGFIPHRDPHSFHLAVMSSLSVRYSARVPFSALDKTTGIQPSFHPLLSPLHSPRALPSAKIVQGERKSKLACIFLSHGCIFKKHRIICFILHLSLLLSPCFRAHDILNAHFSAESPPRKKKRAMNILTPVKLRIGVDFSIVC